MRPPIRGLTAGRVASPSIEAWCAAQRTARSAQLCSYLYMAYGKGGKWEMCVIRSLSHMRGVVGSSLFRLVQPLSNHQVC
eukprot:285206-Prymnesium_polylepis.2